MALSGTSAASHQTKARFFRQAGTLFAAGLTADRVFSILSADGSLKSLSILVSQARMRVERGEMISNIFETLAGSFDRHDIAVIRAAEASGDLAGGCKELAGYHERAAKNAERLQRVLTYPVLLLIVTGLVLGLMMIVVAPRFADLFQSQGIAPGPELSALLTLSDWLVRFWWVPVASLMVFAALLLSKKGREVCADRFLELPIVGPLLEELEVERWSRALSAMVGRGVGLPEALDTASGLLKTPKLQKLGAGLSRRVTDGRALSLAMAETGAFPESAIQLVRVGEESGTLAEMLLHISSYHAEQAERRLTRALSLIEPAIILVLGGIVAVIVLVLMSAVGDLNKLVL